MALTERLIDEILAASRIPSGKRRWEVRRELRAHMEDFVSAGRQSGRSEDEIERLLLERFGDPRQIAQQFAWVYRRERAALHLGGLVISILLVSLVVAAAAITMQAGVRSGLGEPARLTFASRHSLVMTLDILASAAAYLGLLSLERFSRRPLAMLAVIASAWAGVLWAAGISPYFVLFGFANGALLRAVQAAVRHPALRLAGALVCFALLGAVFFPPSSSTFLATSTSWAIMGSSYYLMTHLAARLDRVLLSSF